MNVFNQSLKVLSSKRKGIFLFSFIGALSFSLLLFEYAQFHELKNARSEYLNDEVFDFIESDQIINITYDLPAKRKEAKKVTRIIPVENISPQRSHMKAIEKISSTNSSNSIVSSQNSPCILKTLKKEKIVGFNEINLSNYPYFKKCENILDPIERYKCTQANISSFLFRNTVYPAIPKEIGIEGTVIISFIINKKGKVEDPKILRSVDYQLDEEALRVIKKLPEFIAGNINGSAINVRFEVPIRFKLAKN